MTGKQEAKLQTTSFDSYRAYQWILQNQDKFEKEVFGPPIVTCSVTDQKYADAVESILQKMDFMSFTVQSKNDFRTLQKYLLGQLKLSDISIKTCTVPLGQFTPPNVDIQRLGFDGWAKDFLAGPDPVLAMLCMENKLNQTPIGLREISDDAYTEMENGSLGAWVAGKSSYNVTRRREYGPSAKTTRVRQVRPAQAWTSKPADASVKQRYLEDIRQSKGELAELETQLNTEREALAQIANDHAKVNKEHVCFFSEPPAILTLTGCQGEIESEKSSKQTAHTQWRAIPERIGILFNISFLFDYVC